MGIPLLGYKLNLNWEWKEEKWKDYYYIDGTNIIDAAVLERDSYIKDIYVLFSISKAH